LKPWDQRRRNAYQILPEVAAKVAPIPGVQSFAILPPALPGGGQFPVEVVIASTAEPSEILGFAQQIQQKAAASGIFAFPPIIDTKIDQPQSEIEVDRDKVAELGLNLQTVGQDLGAAVGGNFVNRFSVAGRSYKVIPQLLRVERMNPEQLQDVHVTGPNGQLVALSTIATIRDSVTPRALNRFQQLNAVKLSGVPFRPLDVPHHTLHFFTDGWTNTLNVYSQVGLVTLVGLVSKNSIIIVEFGNKLQEEGQTKIEAGKNAAVTRLRPVLMTGVATVCGHFPLT